MKGIVKLHIEILVSGTEEEIEKVVADPKTIVAEECFIDLGRKVLDAEVLDVELTDDNVDIKTMLDKRYSGEKESIIENIKL